MDQLQEQASKKRDYKETKRDIDNKYRRNSYA